MASSADNDPGGELSASTGKNDSSSAWGSGLLDTVGSFGSTAGNIYKAFTGGSKTSSTASKSALPSWAIPAAAGVALLALLLVFITRK